MKKCYRCADKWIAACAAINVKMAQLITRGGSAEIGPPGNEEAGNRNAKRVPPRRRLTKREQ